MREKILLVGDSNTSKTFSLIALAVQMPDKKVVIFDPDDGTGKVLGELGLTLADLPNLSIKSVKNDWDKLKEDYDESKEELGEGDWLCLDMMGRFWDMAQNYYSVSVFGKSHAEHLMMLKRQAQSTSFGGFDGLQDWPLIKNIHNTDFVDDAVLYSPFNVMCTTSVTPFSPKEKVPKKGTLSMYASEFGVKPEGEKHNVYRFDTQAFMYRLEDDTYHFRMIRDRGRTINLKKEFDITGKSFYEVYAEYREIEL